MKYTSKQVQIFRPDEIIYRTLSNFENFTPILSDKVEGWTATDETCSFIAKGYNIGLKMDERTPNSLIKVTGDERCGIPIPFTFWIQMKSMDDTADPDTRVRIVLDVELNTMMKMMLGNKMQTAVDTIADQIANAFNQAQL